MIVEALSAAKQRVSFSCLHLIYKHFGFTRMLVKYFSENAWLCDARVAKSCWFKLCAFLWNTL